MPEGSEPTGKPERKPIKVTVDKRKAIIKLYGGRAKMSMRQIAVELDLAYSTVNRVLRSTPGVEIRPRGGSNRWTKKTDKG